jgi:hypothetical protein
VASDWRRFSCNELLRPLRSWRRLIDIDGRHLGNFDHVFVIFPQNISRFISQYSAHHRGANFYLNIQLTTEVRHFH